MSKKIVVGLDPSDYTKTALQIAIRRAKELGSLLVGVTVVNTEDIKDSVGGAPVGAIHYAEKAVEKNITLAQKRAQELINNFEKLCKENNIKYLSFIKDGNPAEEIIEEAKTSDLIIIGIKTHFHLEHPDVEGDTLKDLLKETVAPVMAVTEKPNLPTKLLIAYDGSTQAAKAMREYIHISHMLPFAKKAYLLNVTDNIEEGTNLLKKAQSYLELYGIDVERIIKSGDPADVIYQTAKELGDVLIIMGAYGHSGLKELFFGSTAEKIIEDGSFPIFVYH